MLRPPHLFPVLRQQRRWLSLVLLAAFAVGMAAAFTHCAGSFMTAAGMHDAADVMACPGKLCASMETDARDSGAGGALLSGGLPLWPAVLFTLLALVTAPRRIPVPPLPLLPKRPRALKFYALRI